MVMLVGLLPKTIRVAAGRRGTGVPTTAAVYQLFTVIDPMVGGNVTERGQGVERRSMALLLSARVAAMRRWVPPSFTFSFLRRVSAGMSKLRVAAGEVSVAGRGVIQMRVGVEFF